MHPAQARANVTGFQPLPSGAVDHERPRSDWLAGRRSLVCDSGRVEPSPQLKEHDKSTIWGTAVHDLRDHSTIHCPVPRFEEKRQTCCECARRSPDPEQRVKRGFGTGLEQDGLSAWYSWVDSNHRPPDPQSAVVARHDRTNPVTSPPTNARYSGTSVILSGLVSDTARHDQTEGLCYPSVTPTSVGLESWRTSRRDRCALPLATARGFSGLRQRDRAREPTTKRTGLFSRTESGSGRSNHASRGRLGAGLARSRSSANWL